MLNKTKGWILPLVWVAIGYLLVSFFLWPSTGVRTKVVQVQAEPGNEAYEIQVRNSTQQEIKILGTRVSCPCAQLDQGYDESIRPGDSILMNVAVRDRPDKKKILVTLYTDAKSSPELSVTL